MTCAGRCQETSSQDSRVQTIKVKRKERLRLTPQLHVSPDRDMLQATIAYYSSHDMYRYRHYLIRYPILFRVCHSLDKAIDIIPGPFPFPVASSFWCYSLRKETDRAINHSKFSNCIMERPRSFLKRQPAPLFQTRRFRSALSQLPHPSLHPHRSFHQTSLPNSAQPAASSF